MDPLSYLCHQREDRCFQYRGSPMQICSRCLGFYSGFLFGGILFSLFELFLGLVPDFAPITFFIVFGALQLPLVIDGLAQYRTGYESNNVLRLATGILSGAGIGGFVAFCGFALFG